MTFLDIFQDVARRCDKNPTNPDPETNTRLRTFINDRYRELLRLPGVLDLRDEVFWNPLNTFTFQSATGVNRYPLPATISAITNITDSTHRIKLTRRALSWIREHDPSQPGTSSGTPTCYAVLNHAGILPAQSDMSTSLEVVSDSTSDVGGVVTIEYRGGGEEFAVVRTTLSGTTPVTLSTSGVAQVFRVYVETQQQGTVSLSDINGNILATIAPSQLVSQTNNSLTTHGWTVWLWPTPSGVNDYTVDGTRPRAALVEDMDEPALPEDFHTLLVWGACEDELLHMDDTRSQAFADRWRRDVAALKGFLHQVRGERLIPTGGRQRPGWSPLGGNYPPWQ